MSPAVGMQDKVEPLALTSCLRGSGVAGPHHWQGLRAASPSHLCLLASHRGPVGSPHLVLHSRKRYRLLLELFSHLNLAFPSLLFLFFNLNFILEFIRKAEGLQTYVGLQLG